MKTNYNYHVPVLLSQCIEALKIKQDHHVVDVTFGAGGHSKPILELLNAKGHLYAFDQDVDALGNAYEVSNFSLYHSNYRYISDFLRLDGVEKVDGILADLGISSFQVDEPSRGFSFRFDADLDMRMNEGGEKSAIDVLNDYEEGHLVHVFSLYGEVRNAKTLAKAILKARKSKKICTTSQLNFILDEVKMGPMNKYAAQVYQSLRIEVNDEMEALKGFLNQCVELLKPGGRLVVISYHSLEDRLVKNLIKAGNVDGVLEKDEYGNIFRPFKNVSKGVMLPDHDEVKRNPRARSAKLRVAERRE